MYVSKNSSQAKMNETAKPIHLGRACKCPHPVWNTQSQKLKNLQVKLTLTNSCFFSFPFLLSFLSFSFLFFLSLSKGICVCVSGK
jgi:hypothetical protein